MMLGIKSEAMSSNGSSVDYSKVKESPSFHKYKDTVKQLAFVDLKPLQENEKTAFLINLYNSMTIHAIIEDLLPEKDATSTVSRLQLYATASYQIGNMVFSLNDIENGLLRRNRQSAVPMTKPPFQ